MAASQVTHFASGVRTLTCHFRGGFHWTPDRDVLRARQITESILRFQARKVAEAQADEKNEKTG